MRRETLSYIRKYHMLDPGDRVVAGLSGGADSVCLLHLLWCLREELGIALFAVHVHHGIRGAEADRDALFAENFCKKLGIPCRVARIRAEEEAKEAGIGVEEAGRLARYRIFEEEAGRLRAAGLPGNRGTGGGEPAGPGGVKIATAHHADDSVETILFNLFRGSGLKGLGGIAPVRGAVIRPILWADRGAIRAYLASEGLEFVEDSTNGAEEYARNRIRNRILPLAESEINERAAKNILRAGGWIAGADRFLERQAALWLDEHGEVFGQDRPGGAAPVRTAPPETALPGTAPPETALPGTVPPETAPLGTAPPETALPETALPGTALPGTAPPETAPPETAPPETAPPASIAVPAGLLREEEPVFGGYILRLALQRIGCPLRDVTAAHVEAALALTEKQSGRQVELPGGYCVVREFGRLKLAGGKAKGKPEEEAALPELRFDIFPCEDSKDFPKNQCTKWFDYDKIKNTLSIRHRQPGDYITLPGGRRKTLKTFFIDEKIPAEQRRHIALLAEGSHILWVVGFRISEYYKVTEQTKTILRVQLDGGTSGGR